ncbi:MULTISPECIES: polysaccharide deacetylase family protein [Paraburkholderia]|uniref:Polysaccharide deacetylase n=1 Tax=Paraburkholderia podalyriae TaxID=1938811 RepID=A0ABR7PZS7_9BURK|nr:polysaccharide deacetylase [Paraburkholderia podalyriae]MBC8751684.1 polysaccharide deacetylase [Paraburkholderia podalyriae]
MTTAILSFDFDALAIWMSTFKQVTPTPLSRGEYGATVGMPRILEMLDRRGVKATFFVPAHTARTFPQLTRRLVDTGHEVGVHGLIHETPVGLSLDEERSALHESIAILADITGKRPVGYRSPAWDLSENTIALLEEAGLIYDSSLMAGDFKPFFARKGDVMSAEMFQFGTDSDVLEFPVAWELDDFPYFQFVTKPINQGLRLTEDVLSLWKGEFDTANEEEGVFTLTNHPEIIGRGPRVKMLEQLIAYMQSKSDVKFMTMGEAALEIRHSA